ncbi:hypothetical protein [Streptomyces sp. NPDC004728]|uniref:hypothetical protein n=1 Tax=Streptomyces sp. NPDC004728 TaxID=3154289 RepID=UPI0033AD4099
MRSSSAAPEEHHEQHYCGSAAARLLQYCIHADRILTDPAWPTLITALAHSEPAGYRPHRLLAQAAAERELDTAKCPAQVLICRITTQPAKQVWNAPRRSPLDALMPATSAPVDAHTTRVRR